MVGHSTLNFNRIAWENSWKFIMEGIMGVQFKVLNYFVKIKLVN